MICWMISDQHIFVSSELMDGIRSTPFFYDLLDDIESLFMICLMIFDQHILLLDDLFDGTSVFVLMILHYNIYIYIYTNIYVYIYIYKNESKIMIFDQHL